jgi:hypothetical protein
MPPTAGSYTLTASASAGGATGTLAIDVIAATADLGLRVPATTLEPKIGHSVRVGVVLVDDGPPAESTASPAINVPPQLRLVAATTSAGTCSTKTLTRQAGGVGAGAASLAVLSFQGVKAGKEASTSPLPVA